MKRTSGWGIAVAFAGVLLAGTASASERAWQWWVERSSNPWPDAWAESWCTPWSDRTTIILPERRADRYPRYSRSRWSTSRSEPRSSWSTSRSESWSNRSEYWDEPTRSRESSRTKGWDEPGKSSRWSSKSDPWYEPKSSWSTKTDPWKEPKSSWSTKTDRWEEPKSSDRRDRWEEPQSSRWSEEWSDRRGDRWTSRRDRWDDGYRYGYGHANVQFSILGGVQALKHNDDVFADNVYSVPAIGMLSLAINPAFALEGEFTMSVPVRQTVEFAPSMTAERKGPDLLLYQGGVRIGSPAGAWTPYVAAGAGFATFLQNAEPNRYPQIDRAQTMPALNVGAGALVRMSPMLSLRLDFREFAIFPPATASGITTDGSTETIWAPRGAIGFTYGY